MDRNELYTELDDTRFKIVGYFIGGRTPTDDQMVKVEELRQRKAELENKLAR